MKNEEEINKKIERTLKSFDGIKRAEGAPYLLTRINVKMSKQSTNIWDNIAVFICRRAVMVFSFCLFLTINTTVIIILGAQKTTVTAERSSLAEEEEYTTIYTTFYNTENP